MATLVSPGVSVTVIDESFYIPASAPTVPLFFIATRKGKTQADGITPADGTNEYSVVRTVTSLGQSAQLYGIPYFWKDSAGNQYHGDARNEYGLMALNQFLGIGNLAYVVRANVDLTDAASQFVGVGLPRAGAITLVASGNGTLTGVSATSVFAQPEKIDVVLTSSTTFTVLGSISGIIGTGTVGTPFTSTTVNLTVNAGSTPFSADDYFEFTLGYVPTSFTGVGNGTMSNLNPDSSLLPTSPAANELWTVTFTSPTVYDVVGSITGPTGSGTVGIPFDNNFINFTINAGSTAFAVGDTFTVQFQSISKFNPLGANDAAKRVAIVTALQAEINSNTEVRSELYEYNLILCPGYHETADELVALSVSVNEEAFVIADTPVNKTPEQTALWALTAERTNSTNIAYYYPWGYASNLDGTNVVCAASGIALRTYAYSDNVSYVWEAPAGARRGVVSGVNSMGYVTGTIGTATTYVQANLNQGQRNALYEYNKNINPIAYFPGQGILVWGQKTSAPAASTLDRVNAMRGIMYLRRALRKGSMPYVFEPNDQITRNDLKNMADGIMADMQAKRGLYDFASLSDETNNTATRIDQNQLWLDIAVKVVKAAEFIYIPIRVLTTGATMPT